MSMQRRSALKNLALTVGGLVAMPAWATSWTRASVQHAGFLAAPQEALLAEVVETIIPATETPGAKALQVHQFVQKMIADCYEPTAQETLRAGLRALDEKARASFGKPFAEGDTAQRTSLLAGLAASDDAALKGFYSLVKGLTIRGYLNSEYVMTNLTRFEFAPGRYRGCVPVVARTVTEKK